MTSKLAQKVGLKLFDKHLAQYTPADPLYETYTDNRGKERRRKVCQAFVGVLHLGRALIELSILMYSESFRLGCPNET